MTALSDEIKSIIAASGPMSFERFMELALAHPEQGYYMNRDPFGAAGDFTTAPEISQMFGELVGLWSAEVWREMGSPNPLRLIELGPGRGTLMSDALRAARLVPEFRDALDVTLVETSPKLAQIQYEALASCGVGVAWQPTFSEAPPGPAIVIANEFLDALPVRQYVYSNGRWRERVVKIDAAGELTFGVSSDYEPYILAPGEEGDILEVNPAEPSLDVRARGADGEAGRRRAVRRLRPRRNRRRRHAAGAAQPPLRFTALRPRRSRHHRPCRFLRYGA